MHVRIRADILNAALHAVSRSSSGRLPHRLIFPDASNDHYTLADVMSCVPTIKRLLEEYIANGDSSRNPAYAFFSIDPPGMWMQLTWLIGPNAEYVDAFLDSEEALGILLNAFMPTLETLQDEWYERVWIGP